VELVIGNSHAVESAERLKVPILRAGFPQYDWVGGYATTRAGYRGTRQALFDLANMLGEGRHHRIEPYHSKLSQKRDEHPREAIADDSIELCPIGTA
jgi:nitrogenase molybdenum-iron protein NifN